MTQNVGTYDEAVTGSKQNFFSVSTFESHTTKYRGTLVENEKVKYQPTLLYSGCFIKIKDYFLFS
jgi:hypothetical protein